MIQVNAQKLSHDITPRTTLPLVLYLTGSSTSTTVHSTGVMAANPWSTRVEWLSRTQVRCGGFPTRRRPLSFARTTEAVVAVGSDARKQPWHWGLSRRIDLSSGLIYERSLACVCLAVVCVYTKFQAISLSSHPLTIPETINMPKTHRAREPWALIQTRTLPTTGVRRSCGILQASCSQRDLAADSSECPVSVEPRIHKPPMTDPGGALRAVLQRMESPYSSPLPQSAIPSPVMLPAGSWQAAHSSKTPGFILRWTARRHLSQAPSGQGRCKRTNHMAQRACFGTNNPVTCCVCCAFALVQPAP